MDDVLAVQETEEKLSHIVMMIESEVERALDQIKTGTRCWCNDDECYADMFVSTIRYYNNPKKDKKGKIHLSLSAHMLELALLLANRHDEEFDIYREIGDNSHNITIIAMAYAIWKYRKQNKLKSKRKNHIKSSRFTRLKSKS